MHQSLKPTLFHITYREVKDTSLSTSSFPSSFLVMNVIDAQYVLDTCPSANPLETWVICHCSPTCQTMANLRLCVAGFILLTFFNLAVNIWSPYIFNTFVTEEKSGGQVSQDDWHKLQNHQHNLNSQKSMFRDATCEEDIQNINAIQNTNIEAKSFSQLAEIFYKSVTRPVQGKVHGKHVKASQM